MYDMVMMGSRSGYGYGYGMGMGMGMGIQMDQTRGRYCSSNADRI